MPTKIFKPTTPLAKGTYKVAERATSTATKKPGTYSIREPLNSSTDYMIVKFSKGSADDIFDELKLYYEFGQRGISPIVYFVKIPGIKEPLTLSKFVRLYENKGVLPESYLVEKSNCGRVILAYYGSDFVNLFSNLREFIADKIVANGLVNTDIKIPNLCIDGAGKFKLIDLDPNFIQKIQRDPLSKKTFTRVTIHDDDYINYMLFQVYVNMCASGRMQHDPQLFGRFFTRESLIQMIDRLSLFEAAKEYTHPISNLLWYSKLGKTRDQYSSAREIFDEIMQKFGVAVPVGDTQTVNFLTPTALSPTALSPTAPSPTAPSHTEESQNSDKSMSPSVFRMYDYDDSVSYNLSPQKIFEESMVDDSISDRSLGGKSRGGSRCKTKKNKKKLRRNKSTRC